MSEGWLEGLSEKDWLLDGEAIRSEYQKTKWAKLDWSRAWMDMGPSPMGNPGPYWHVPWDYDGEELWARCYPKLLLTKWLPLVRQACEEAAKPKYPQMTEAELIAAIDALKPTASIPEERGTEHAPAGPSGNP
jgi:hypothetical protein